MFLLDNIPTIVKALYFVGWRDRPTTKTEIGKEEKVNFHTHTIRWNENEPQDFMTAVLKKLRIIGIIIYIITK